MGEPAVADKIESASVPAGKSQCALLTELVRMDHYVLSVDRACGLLVARRTAAPFQRIGDIESCFLRLEQALSALTRRRYRLLVDARLGPSRNDPAFEEAMGQHRGKLLFGFQCNAALMATAAGRLQVRRYAKADGREVFVTDSAEAAFAYLRIPHHSI